MSINFPSSLDNFANPVSTDLLDNSSPTLDHWTQHSNNNDAIEALEAKVGVDGSAVTTSHDYKLSEVTSSDKAVGKTATQTLTNKTLTSPVINVGSDATGDMYYRNASGALTRLPAGTDTQIIIYQSGIPTVQNNPAGSDASTTVKGVVEIATTAEITAGTSTGGTGAILVVPASAVGSAGASKLVQFDSSGKYPAADGSAITNITNPAVYKNGTTTYNLTTASGTQTIAHGLGKTPKYIRIKWILSITDSGTDTKYRGDGVYNGTTVSSIQEGTNGASGTGAYSNYIDTTNIINYNSGGTGSDVQQRAVPTFDGTNITLTWTKTGSPSGTINILWEAFA